MEEEIGVGNLVKHRANRASDPLVVVSRKEEHGYVVYECRWYNRISGSYELGKFYSSELDRIKG